MTGICAKNYFLTRGGEVYKVAHIGLVVKDVEQSAEFYCKVLGCTKVDEQVDDRLKIWVLRAGNQLIELLQYLKVDQGERGAGAIDHICFQVDDMDDAVAKLRAAGVKLLFDAPRLFGNGRKIFFFAGPDGERLEFLQEAMQ